MFLWRAKCRPEARSEVKNDNKTLLDSVAAIVSAYVAGSQVPAQELPELIREVHRSLSAEFSGKGPFAMSAQRKPAAAPGRSVRPDAIVCLEDGRTFRSLKRHLQVAHGLSPSEYRTKWALGPDYPMTAPAYAAERSRLAKKAGLGKSRGQVRGRRGRKRAGAKLNDAA